VLHTPTQTVWYQRGHESHLTQFTGPGRFAFLRGGGSMASQEWHISMSMAGDAGGAGDGAGPGDPSSAAPTPASASGAATTSTSAVCGRFRPPVRFRLFRLSCVRFTTRRLSVPAIPTARRAATSGNRLRWLDTNTSRVGTTLRHVVLSCRARWKCWAYNQGIYALLSQLSLLVRRSTRRRGSACCLTLSPLLYQRRYLLETCSESPPCRAGCRPVPGRRCRLVRRSVSSAAGEFDWSRAYSPAVNIWADSSSSPLAGEWRKWGVCSETYRGRCGMCRPRPPSIYKQLAAYFKVLKALRVSTTTSNAVVTFIKIISQHLSF